MNLSANFKETIDNLNWDISNLNEAVANKLDTPPSGGLSEQILTKTETGIEWKYPEEAQYIDKKTLISSAYIVDFNGKVIQKYLQNSLASGTVEIECENLSSLQANKVKTIELQIPVIDTVSTIVLPSTVQIIEMPDELESESGVVAYHDIVFRAEENPFDDYKIYVNYAYKFKENTFNPDNYFRIENLEANNSVAIVRRVRYSSQYFPIVNGMEYSFDGYSWNSYNIGDAINLPNIGDKVYFRGSSGNLNNGGSNPENNYHTLITSKSVDIAGNIVSLIDKTLSIQYIPANCFRGLFKRVTNYESKIINASGLIIPDIPYGNEAYADLFSENRFVTPPTIEFTNLSGIGELNRMFSFCPNLTEIRVNFTDWLSGNSTHWWVYGISSSSGTFYCPTALGTNATIERGNDYCPTNWTVVNTDSVPSGNLLGNYCPDCGSGVVNGWCTNTDCHNSENYNGGFTQDGYNCGEFTRDATGRCFNCGYDSNGNYTAYCEECGACDTINDGHYDWHDPACSQYKPVCETCWMDKELENGNWVCTNPSCPESPYYVPTCDNCGSPMESDGDGGWICTNAECENSPYYEGEPELEEPFENPDFDEP